MHSEQVIKIDESLSADRGFFLPPQHELFRNNALLAGIDDRLYAQIERNIEVLRCHPREVIFEEDDPGDSLYLIAQGAVRISKRGRRGQQETLAHFLERDFFGEMALVDSGRRSAQAAAVGHAVLGRIDRETWDLLLRLAPHQVLSNFTRSVTTRLRQNNQHFIEQMVRTERLSLIGTTVSSIVNEMTTPIGEILAACEALEPPTNAALSAEPTHAIRHAVGRMNGMMAELIEFSRGKTNLRLQPGSVKELVANLQPELAKCEAEAQLRLDVSCDAYLNADLPRLLRVFGCLFASAREALDRAKQKEIGFAVRAIDEKVRFEISDTGAGIPKELLPKIFEPFVTQRKANGSGFALAISKAIVEAHHGTISVSSSDRGTTFEIELPVAV